MLGENFERFSNFTAYVDCNALANESFSEGISLGNYFCRIRRLGLAHKALEDSPLEISANEMMDILSPNEDFGCFSLYEDETIFLASEDLDSQFRIVTACLSKDSLTFILYAAVEECNKRDFGPPEIDYRIGLCGLINRNGYRDLSERYADKIIGAVLQEYFQYPSSEGKFPFMIGSQIDSFD